MPPIFPAPITAKRLCDRGLVIGRVFLGRLPLRSIADPIRIGVPREAVEFKRETSLRVWRAANWFRSRHAVRRLRCSYHLRAIHPRIFLCGYSTRLYTF